MVWNIWWGVRVASRPELIKGQVLTWADTAPRALISLYAQRQARAPGISCDFQYNYKEHLNKCFDMTVIHKHAFVLYYQIKVLLNGEDVLKATNQIPIFHWELKTSVALFQAVRACCVKNMRTLTPWMMEWRKRRMMKKGVWRRRKEI